MVSFTPKLSKDTSFWRKFNIIKKDTTWISLQVIIVDNKPIHFISTNQFVFYYVTIYKLSCHVLDIKRELVKATVYDSIMVQVWVLEIFEFEVDSDGVQKIELPYTFLILTLNIIWIKQLYQLLFQLRFILTVI